METTEAQRGVCLSEAMAKARLDLGSPLCSWPSARWCSLQTSLPLLGPWGGPGPHMGAWHPAPFLLGLLLPETPSTSLVQVDPPWVLAGHSPPGTHPAPAASFAGRGARGHHEMPCSEVTENFQMVLGEQEAKRGALEGGRGGLGTPTLPHVLSTSGGGGFQQEAGVFTALAHLILTISLRAW